MADTAGQQDIRGLDVQKLVTGFAEEDIILRRFCRVSSTEAREVRWFQKTAGFLTSTDTTGITASRIPTSARTRPVVVQPSFTRNTSYIRKFFVESEIISEEDIRDSDVDILATTIRDLTRAVLYEEELHIWDVVSESQSASTINSVSTNAAWNAASYTGVNIVEDLLDAKKQIRDNAYNPEGAVLLLNTLNHKSLITWLIDGKGASIPQFSSNRLEDGIVMEILGLRVVVSTIVTADYALVMVPQTSVTVKEFVPITARVITDEGIGRKVRVWLESVALLTDPKSVCIITNTDA